MFPMGLVGLFDLSIRLFSLVFKVFGADTLNSMAVGVLSQNRKSRFVTMNELNVFT